MQHLLQEAVRDGLYTNALFEAYDSRDRLLVSAGVGSFPRADALPILSASKWVSAAIAIALVERGALHLDLPVSRWLTTESPLTIRHLLSFTSGLDQSAPEFKDPNLSLREAASAILGQARFAAGEAFDYGDGHFTVVGAAAELATGASWQELFREILADPLGWAPEAAYYAKPSSRKGERNPRPAAGLVVSFDDYLKFLRVISSYGLHRGRRLLLADSVREMEADQLGSARIEGSGFRDAGLRAGYGFGLWRELGSEGRTPCVSSPGLFGYYPWIDREAGVYGLLGAKEPLPVMQKALPFLQRLRQAAVNDFN